MSIKNYVIFLCGSSSMRLHADNKNQILNTYMHKYRQIYTNKGLQNLYRRNVKTVLS